MPELRTGLVLLDAKGREFRLGKHYPSGTWQIFDSQGNDLYVKATQELIQDTFTVKPQEKG